MTSKPRQTPDPAPVDLDLTPLLPQIWTVRVGEKIYQVNSDQPPHLLFKAAQTAQRFHAALDAGADTSPLVDVLADLVARVLQISRQEADALGWTAFVRLFAFLVQPLNDLTMMMSLSNQLSPSASALEGA